MKYSIEKDPCIGNYLVYSISFFGLRKIITYLKSFKELKEENEKLKNECIARRHSEEDFKWERDQYKKERDELADFLRKNEELKEMIKSRGEYHKMADSESRSIKDGLIVKLSW